MVYDEVSRQVHILDDTFDLAALRRSGADLSAVLKAYDEQVTPKRNALSAAINNFTTQRQNQLEAAILNEDTGWRVDHEQCSNHLQSQQAGEDAG